MDVDELINYVTAVPQRGILDVYKDLYRALEEREEVLKRLDNMKKAKNTMMNKYIEHLVKGR